MRYILVKKCEECPYRKDYDICLFFYGHAKPIEEYMGNFPEMCPLRDEFRGGEKEEKPCGLQR